ncbi:MAG: CrcB family protein [Acidimicrobiia bacterium]|nr:CrcB family protein [Acidimicrobiia bacterium]
MLAVAIGGAAGGLIRTALAEISSHWPWPTLLVNIFGSFVLGLVVVYGRRHWPAAVIAGVAVGLLGSLTTFSTMAGELWDAVDTGAWGILASYGLASVVGGALAAVAGIRIGRAVR